MNTINFKKFDYVIADININDNGDTIIINLIDAPVKYKLEAAGDCCSYSNFEEYKDYDFSQLSGKIIKGIKEIQYPDDDDPNDYDPRDDDYDDNYINKYHLYEIRFKNSHESFKFQMVNHSNGYYDGWMNISIMM